MPYKPGEFRHIDGGDYDADPRDRPNEDGFWAAAKRSGASMVGGLGEIYADITGDKEHDNALTRFDDRVQRNNPSEINSLQDIADNPWLATKVAAGGALGFLGPGLAGKALGAVGTGMKMARVARTGEALNSFKAQTGIMGLPSVRGIGEQQRESGEEENDLLKYAASAAVGAVETGFGIQRMLGIGTSAAAKGGRELISEFGKTPLRTAAKTMGRVALEEGAEELAQNPMEQYAGYQDPTTQESLEQTAFGGAMGAIGGATFGLLGGARAGLQHKNVRDQLRQDQFIDPQGGTPTDLLQGLDRVEQYNQVQDDWQAQKDFDWVPEHVYQGEQQPADPEAQMYLDEQAVEEKKQALRDTLVAKGVRPDKIEGVVEAAFGGRKRKPKTTVDDLTEDGLAVYEALPDTYSEKQKMRIVRRAIGGSQDVVATEPKLGKVATRNLAQVDMEEAAGTITPNEAESIRSIWGNSPKTQSDAHAIKRNVADIINTRRGVKHATQTAQAQQVQPQGAQIAAPVQPAPAAPVPVPPVGAQTPVTPIQEASSGNIGQVVPPGSGQVPAPARPAPVPAPAPAPAPVPVPPVGAQPPVTPVQGVPNGNIGQVVLPGGGQVAPQQEAPGAQAVQQAGEAPLQTAQGTQAVEVGGEARNLAEQILSYLPDGTKKQRNGRMQPNYRGVLSTYLGFEGSHDEKLEATAAAFGLKSKQRAWQIINGDKGKPGAVQLARAVAEEHGMTAEQALQAFQSLDAARVVDTGLNENQQEIARDTGALATSLGSPNQGMMDFKDAEQQGMLTRELHAEPNTKARVGSDDANMGAPSLAKVAEAQLEDQTETVEEKVGESKIKANRVKGEHLLTDSEIKEKRAAEAAGKEQVKADAVQLAKLQEAENKEAEKEGRAPRKLVLADLNPEENRGATSAPKYEHEPEEYAMAKDDFDYFIERSAEQGKQYPSWEELPQKYRDKITQAFKNELNSPTKTVNQDKLESMYAYYTEEHATERRAAEARPAKQRSLELGATAEAGPEVQVDTARVPAGEAKATEAKVEPPKAQALKEKAKAKKESVIKAPQMQLSDAMRTAWNEGVAGPMNVATWDSLSPAQQKALMDVADAAPDEQTKVVDKVVMELTGIKPFTNDNGGVTLRNAAGGVTIKGGGEIEPATEVEPYENPVASTKPTKVVTKRKVVKPSQGAPVSYNTKFERDGKPVTVQGIKTDALGREQVKVDGEWVPVSSLTRVPPKGVKQSRTFFMGAEGVGATAQQIEDQLKGFFFSGERFKRKVTVVQSRADLPASVRNLEGVKNHTQAFVVDGHAYMIADNIPVGNTLAVLLHEVGVHLGMKGIVGTANFNKLVGLLKEWEKQTGTKESEIVRRARARVEAAETEEVDQDEELLAYFIEEAVNAGVNPAALHKVQGPMQAWFRTLWAAVKSAMRKFGFDRVEKMTAADLVNLAYGAARLEIEGTWHGTAGEFRRFSHNYMGSGEGAQAYGWGTYLAERPGIAKGYWEADVQRKGRGGARQGSLMRIDTSVHEDEYLDLDVPFKQQSKKVQNILSEYYEKFEKENSSGHAILNSLERIHGKKGASTWMDSVGIKGNKFSDSQSRALRRYSIEANVQYAGMTAPYAIVTRDAQTGEIVHITREASKEAAERAWKRNADIYETENARENTRNRVIFNDKNIHRVFSEVGADRNKLRFSFVGTKAAANKGMKSGYVQAVLMDSNGVPMKDIWRDTNWFKWVDGKWRYELSDRSMKWKSNALYDMWERHTTGYGSSIGSLIRHDTLFGAYPSLHGDLLVFLDDELPPNNASINALGTRILLSAEQVGTLAGLSKDSPEYKRASNKLLEILAHEVQHAIQSMEGFSGGGNTTSLMQLVDNKTFTEQLRDIFESQIDVRPHVEEYVVALNALLKDFDKNKQTFLNLKAKQATNFEWKRSVNKAFNLPETAKQNAGLTMAQSILYERYLLLAGEIEADDVSARIKNNIGYPKLLVAGKHDALQSVLGEDRLHDTHKPKFSQGASVATLPEIHSFTESSTKDMIDRVRTTAKDLGKKALNTVVFMHDLIGIAKREGLTTAGGFNDLMGEKDQVRNKKENQLDQIMQKASKLRDQDKAEAFIRDSTLYQKWGYGDKADPVMRARFRSLSPEAQEVVKDIFKVGEDDYAEVQRLTNLEVNQEYDELIARYPHKKAEYEKERARDLRRLGRAMPKMSGPYAPFKRFGDHVVVAKSQDYLDAEKVGDQKRMDKLIESTSKVHYSVEFFDTAGAAAYRKKQLNPMFPSVIASNRQENFHKVDELPWSGVAKVKAAIQDSPDTKYKEKMERLVTNLYLRMLAESSARKSEIKRKGVVGAGDMFRAFAAHGRSNAHYLASLTKSKEINRQLTAMKNEAHDASGEQRDGMTRVYNEIAARYAHGLDYKETPWVDKMLRVSSIWMLLTSPAYYLTNATQTYMVALPVIGGRYGWKAATEINRAYMDVAKYVGKMGHELDVSKLPISQTERNMLISLRDKGKLDITIASDLGRWASGAADQGIVGNVMGKLHKAVGQVEALNRITTALAAYRLSGSEQYAGDMVDQTQGNYAGNNAPRFFHANGGAKLMTQFRKYQLIQISVMGRLIHDAFKGASQAERAVARRSLAWLFTQQMLFTGVAGLPVPAVAYMLAAALGGDDDKDWERNLRKWIGDEDMANLLIRGVPAWMGLDVSGRIGMGQAFSILPFSDVDFTKKGYKEAVFGASGAFIGGVGGQVFDGIDKMSKGNYYKGVESMMPRGLRNAMSGYRIATEGVTTGRGDVVLSPDEISVMEGIMKGIGLPTTGYTKFQQGRSDLYELNQHFKERDTEVKDAYARAAKDHDAEAMSKARSEWKDLQESKGRWVEEMKRRGFGDKKLLEDVKPQPLGTLLKSPAALLKREAPWKQRAAQQPA